MDDAVFDSSIASGAPSNDAMELDYMDELLLEGCWLEAVEDYNFIHQSPPSGFYDSPHLWPMLEVTNEKSSISLSEKNAQQVRETSELAENSAVVSVANGQNLVSVANDSNHFEGSEPNKLLWIKPKVNTSGSVMDRLIKAIHSIQDSANDKDMLVQVWVPVTRRGTRILTTSNQPFSVNSSSTQLATYRNISTNYEFAAEEDSSVSVGLPGRVFLGKVPEWTPDVQLFRVDEYPRVPYAQQCNVRGTFALPVFEQGSRNCLGVLEVVMTTQKINYRPELESVCRALEAVDLRSCPEIPSSQKSKEICSSYQVALLEILEVIKSTCSTHGLPLAQTWIPCIQQSKEGCRHSDENLSRCVSTVDSACFVANPSMLDFHEACSEHHLFKGQGVAGKAFLTNQPCFSSDITTYSKTEYPLSHHARMFELCAAVAIRLRCIYTGNADFVLEFFLPTECRDPQAQKKMLTSLSIIIQRVCRSLRVVTDKELEQETLILDDSLNWENMLVENSMSGSSQEELCGTAPQDTERASCLTVHQENQPNEIMGGKLSSQNHQYSNMKGSPGGSSLDYSAVVDGSFSTSVKSGGKKRAKAEKTITLEILRQHFAGSLKDAAKSIGVCPTTLKRICREHGIMRWPSRKIKKVGHSLQKLQVVIDSVQGGSGAFQIGSLYSSFPDLASPNYSNNSPFSTATKQHDDSPHQLNKELEGTATSKSPSSSCSQISNSSQSCSSGSQQQPSTWNVSGNEDPQGGGIISHESVLKRARSKTEFQMPSHETKKVISGSQSQKSLVDNHNNADNHPSNPNCNGTVIQEGGGWRVKVAYGEENIRFRMHSGWRFNDLVQEVVKRFHIGDMKSYHLKYLDDDSEWVLLTCDTDLEECIDICRSSQRQTIKLSLSPVSHNHSSSVASNGPL